MFSWCPSTIINCSWINLERAVVVVLPTLATRALRQRPAHVKRCSSPAPKSFAAAVSKACATSIALDTRRDGNLVSSVHDLGGPEHDGAQLRPRSKIFRRDTAKPARQYLPFDDPQENGTKAPRETYAPRPGTTAVAPHDGSCRAPRPLSAAPAARRVGTPCALQRSV